MLLELTAPLGILGFARTTLPELTEIEVERTASFPGRIASAVHISGTGIDQAVEGFRDSSFVSDVSFLTETGTGTIYQLTWGERLPDFIEHVRTTDGTLLSAIAEADRWQFKLRFPGQKTASRFYTQYDDPDQPLTIHRTSPTGSSQRATRDVLTPEQREALRCAVETGYFEVPRRTTLVELATELGISDTAVSQRLRRGLLTVLHEADSLPLVPAGSEPGPN